MIGPNSAFNLNHLAFLELARPYSVTPRNTLCNLCNTLCNLCNTLCNLCNNTLCNPLQLERRLNLRWNAQLSSSSTLVNGDAAAAGEGGEGWWDAVDVLQQQADGAAGPGAEVREAPPEALIAALTRTAKLAVGMRNREL